MWKDITSYSKSDTVRTPTTFENKICELRISICNDHMDYKGSWVMNCYALRIDALPLLECNTIARAKQRALEIVEWKLDRLQFELAEMKLQQLSES